MVSTKKNSIPEEKLKQLGDELATQILRKQNPSMKFQTRALSNIKYSKQTKRLELGKSMTERSFFNLGHSKKFLQTLEVAAVTKNLLKEEKHASLRDVFYQVKRTIPHTNVNIVDEQAESDSVIEDLELITGLSREQLNINANKNGSVAGKVIVEDRGDIIDWSKMGSGGWSVPSNVEDIKFKKVEAKFILYMEKAAVWERLHEDKFWNKHDCIIMSSQGQTTRGIRRLLQRFYEEYNLPIYVLADLDPWGFYIYSVIKYGSISLAHMSEKLTIQSVRFLGITVEDIKNYGLEKHLIKLKEVDINRIDQLMKYDWFKDNKAWQKQLTELKKLKAKAEIQALSARGISFISDKYLPEKIKKGEFLD